MVPSGKGWVYGVARYSGDRVEWFRVFSYAPRPRRVLDRPDIEVQRTARRPQGSEELALLSDAVVLACTHRGTQLELAMSDDALTGFPGLARGRPARPAGERGVAEAGRAQGGDREPTGGGVDPRPMGG